MFLSTFALDVANGFVSDIQSVCERLEIVGSLRRRREIVNDIDVLVIPKTVVVPDSSLFGGTTQVNLLDAQLSQLNSAGRLGMERNGPRIKRCYMSCDDDLIGIDLYIATPATWWTLLLIRTGSRAHNIWLAAMAAECHMQLKADGSGIIDPSGRLIQIQSEEHIFEILGVPYRPPQERE
jgi:DNA polymerase (family X)